MKKKIYTMAVRTLYNYKTRLTSERQISVSVPVSAEIFIWTITEISVQMHTVISVSAKISVRNLTEIPKPKDSKKAS